MAGGAVRFEEGGDIEVAGREGVAGGVGPGAQLELGDVGVDAGAGRGTRHPA